MLNFNRYIENSLCHKIVTKHSPSVKKFLENNELGDSAGNASELYCDVARYYGNTDLIWPAAGRDRNPQNIRGQSGSPYSEVSS